MLRRVSLANKCLLLFGVAVLGIVATSLLVALIRMNAIIDDGELASLRQAAMVWQAEARRGAEAGGPAGDPEPSAGEVGPVLSAEFERIGLGEVELTRLRADQIVPYRFRPEAKQLVEAAWTRGSVDRTFESFSESEYGFTARRYAIAVVVRGSEKEGGTAASAATGPLATPSVTQATPNGAQVAPVRAIVYGVRTSTAAATSLWLSLFFLVSVGVFALGLAVLVFYLITSKIILEPVRQLRLTAEAVRSGNLDSRSEIATGDDFEDLADAFNEMVGALQLGQVQLRAINNSLDEKINQLAERNLTLYEAAKIKGEFLANVSHELRTPLNSILGFAELLEDQAQREQDSGEDSSKLARRKRYVDNILSAGRSLLELITGLLEMAKVEAGKAELRVLRFEASDLCEQLIAMMRPAADKRGVELTLEVAENLPTMMTDRGKLQQVIFNLLANAVKFTGDMADELRSKQQQRAAEAELMGAPPLLEQLPAAKVTLRAENLIARDPATGQTEDRIRFSVLDTGPGIAAEDQAKIFEKFTQLDSGYGRKHAGTGLGLAICKELSGLLQGEMMIESAVNRGSMFSVVVPVTINPGQAAEAKLELAFRGSLKG